MNAYHSFHWLFHLFPYSGEPFSLSHSPLSFVDVLFVPESYNRRTTLPSWASCLSLMHFVGFKLRARAHTQRSEFIDKLSTKCMKGSGINSEEQCSLSVVWLWIEFNCFEIDRILYVLSVHSHSVIQHWHSNRNRAFFHSTRKLHKQSAAIIALHFINRNAYEIRWQIDFIWCKKIKARERERPKEIDFNQFHYTGPMLIENARSY